MNITLKNIDPVNAIISVNIAKEDYEAEVDKALKNLRQNASFPGFRKGMVPMGMVKKMYEKSVLFEQVNKITSNSLFSYIRDNKINILGEPLPNESEQPVIDFNTQENFEFCFDLGIAPEIDIKLSKKDKLPYYSIQVEDNMIDQQITSYQANYGNYGQTDEIEGKDMAKGILAELDENGTVKEGGIQIDNAVLMPFYMKNEEEKNKFMGTKINTVIIFNPYNAYEGNEAELSSFLKIGKEKVKDYTGNFSFEIQEITRYAEAELNQELFDKVFGEGTVSSEEEFRTKVKETIATHFTPDSDYKFLLDAKELLAKKTEGVIFPDAFLKRWLIASNKERTAESVENDYPKIMEDLRFHLSKEQIVKDNNITVDEAELMEYARGAVRAQFAQYGMANVPADLLENYAKDMLKKEETVRNLYDRAIENKITIWLKDHVTLNTKEVSVDDFKKLFEQN